MNFVQGISLSVGHLINLNDIGSVKSTRSCVVAYVEHFKRGGCDTLAKWRNLTSERLSCTSDITCKLMSIVI